MSSADLVVLGAGPAGVGAAYRASSAGHRVVVLERGDRVGGAAGSFELAGVRVDRGSHRLHPSIDPLILGELRALLGDDLQLRRRNGRILLDGRWIAFPLRPADLVRHLPPSFTAGAARDAVTAFARRPRTDTFAEVVRAGVGPTLAERFYFPYARKLWGLEPDELAGEQARRRIAAGSVRKLLRRAAGGGASTFWYPRRGYGQISEALADAAVAAGAELRLGAEAAQLELGDDRVRVRVAGGEPIDAGRVWSTIPLSALARIGGGPATDGLELRAMALVYLVLPVERYTPYDAHYLPSAWTPVTRVSEPKNYRDGDDPAGVTVLCAELPCSACDEVWAAPDEELGRLVVETLERAGLPQARPGKVVVDRIPHVYPVYRVGFERAFERLDAWASAQPRLLTFGRLGLFVHDNVHHALAMAWAAADALRPGGGFDRDAWAAARERFARHVVED